MSDLKELEEKLQQKNTRKSILDTIRDTFSSGMGEFSKTISNVFDTPIGGKNQITKTMEDYEKKISLIRKK